jgi:uncharacterized protein
VDGSASELFPVRLVILQASPFCNIDCDYCYLGNRLDTRRINLTTLRAVAKFLSSCEVGNDPLTVCWHAGEPLAVSRDFYEDAFSCLRENCTRPTLVHNFQTNATLIDDDWCRFFKKWTVAIGVSVDGPKEIHDAHRVDRARRGTFDRTMRGINHLRDAKVPFSVLCVLTKDMLAQADTMWDFWNSLGVSNVGINPEEIEGTHFRSALFQSAHVEEVRRFFMRLAERQEQAQPKTFQIRELAQMRSQFEARGHTVVHRSVNRAGSIISINLDGDISTFSPELLAVQSSPYGPLTWGNVHRDTWATFAENPVFKRVNAEVLSGTDKCRRSCGYFAVCGGGDPSNKLAENGTFDSTETYHCRLHVKAVADVVMRSLERELGLEQEGAFDGNRCNIDAA